MTKERAIRKATKHKDLIKLSLVFDKKKESIQERFNNGELEGYQQLADEYNIALSTVKELCLQFGIKSAYGTKEKNKDKCSLTAILTVLQRICQQLDINHEEIKPYLYEHTKN